MGHSELRMLYQLAPGTYGSSMIGAVLLPPGAVVLPPGAVVLPPKRGPLGVRGGSPGVTGAAVCTDVVSTDGT